VLDSQLILDLVSRLVSVYAHVFVYYFPLSLSLCHLLGVQPTKA